MLSLQEISDRLEIQELLADYSHALDLRHLDELDNFFTEDAVIDYTEMGGPKGDLAAIKEFLKGSMAIMFITQHLVGTSKMQIDGDRAEVRTICHNPMVLNMGKGVARVFFCGLWYRDTMVRTPAGWRIKERYEEKCHFFNFPGDEPGIQIAELRKMVREWIPTQPSPA